jgi:hypothetical protein
MGQTVYVLMGVENTGKNKMWRPAAVVTNPDIATQWMEYGKDVDWVPLELDEVKNISPGNMPSFHSRETSVGEERASQLSEQMEATIQRMQKIIDDQAALIKKLSKQGAAEDKTPPKPPGFAERLNNGDEIADYIESWAGYPVDNEFVSERFRDCHAELRLLPIAEIKPGWQGANVRNPANERKYQRMSVKTIPPIIVEDGVIVDGHHRFRAAQKRGLTHLWAYVVEWDKGD